MTTNMSMLGVMRDVVNVGAYFVRQRRQVHSGGVDVDSTPGVQIIMPLDVFSAKIARSILIFPYFLWM